MGEIKYSNGEKYLSEKDCEFLLNYEEIIKKVDIKPFISSSKNIKII